MGIGGGLWNWETGAVTITGSHFIDNVARGGSNGRGTFAGLGQGGAIYNDNRLTVTSTLFSGNQAVGGSKTISDIFSGEAVGGAISSGTNERLIGHSTSAVLTVNQSLFIDNQAVGGDENRAGLENVVPGTGGGLGGAIFVFQGDATIRETTLMDNRALGGRGVNGKAGGLAIGGGILFVNFLGKPTAAGPTGVTGIVENCLLLNNEARGGEGGTGGAGGNALGGGLAAGTFGLSPLSGRIQVSNTLIAANIASGGDGGAGGNGGNGQGGGVYNGAGSTMTTNRSKITLNRAQGGEGDGTGSDGVGKGGGVVYNLGSFTLILTPIFGNEADDFDDSFGV